MQKRVKIIECPRDAMQGIKDFIPTRMKADYIQSLLRVGFNTIDFGSFVSPKAIPQMQDTAELLSLLDLSETKSKLLVIIANIRGAKEAVQYSEVDYLGFPFSISEIFQMRNTHKTIAESLILLDSILELSDKYQKQLIVYLSMGFGNPYGEPWNEEIVEKWTEKLVDKGVKILSLSDTIGQADSAVITKLFTHLLAQFPHIEFGAHFHTHLSQWHEKVDAAYKAGCCRFDGAIKGYGGCPIAKDELVGNMPTEKLLSYFQSKKVKTNVNMLHFESAYNEMLKVFEK